MGDKPRLLVRMGDRVKELRKQAGLSQEELAHKAKLSMQYVSTLERGLANPSIQVIDQLAAALKMPLAAFFAFDTTLEEARDDLRAAEALLASLPAKDRRLALRILKVIQAREGGS